MRDKVLKRYLDRLHDSIQRSALLNAYIPKTNTTRIDLARLNIVEKDLPKQLLTKLIYADDNKYRIKFKYDELPKIKEQIRDLEKRGEEVPEQLNKELERLEEIATLHAIVCKKLTKEADFIYRETGLKSLWLGYPIAFVPAPTGKTILAPIFLWQIQIEVSKSEQGLVTISRNEEEAPLYNKAFDYWCIKYLGINPDDPERDSLLEINENILHDKLDNIFKGFVNPPKLDSSTSILSLPNKKTLTQHGKSILFNSAILGIIKWENQALMHDFEELISKADFPKVLESFLSGTSFDVVERDEKVSEKEKHFVCETDFFQEKAILSSRNEPGVIVHGPPGTGKSETIVNIVADALSRGERVLVVCQKRAAIDVVYERLKKAGLDELCNLVHDSNSARTTTIKSLKEQIDGINSGISLQDKKISRRNNLSLEIEAIEKNLDEYNMALYKYDDQVKATYRDVKAHYLTIKDKYPWMREAVEIDKILINLEYDDIKKLEQDIRLLAELSFESDVEINPWKNRNKDLVLDRFKHEEIKNDFSNAIEFVKKVNYFEKTNFLKDLRLSTIDSKTINDIKQGLITLSLLTESNFQYIKSWIFNNNVCMYKKRFDLIEQLLSELENETMDIDVFDFFIKLSDEEFRKNYKLAKLSNDLHKSFIRKFDIISQVLVRNFNSQLKKRNIVLPQNCEERYRLFENFNRWKKLRDMVLYFGQEKLFSEIKIQKWNDCLKEAQELRKLFNDCENLIKYKDSTDLIELYASVKKDSFSSYQKLYTTYLDLIEKVDAYIDAFEAIDILKKWLELDEVDRLKKKLWVESNVVDDYELFISFIPKLQKLINYQTEKKRLNNLSAEIIKLLEKIISKGVLNAHNINASGLSEIWINYIWLNIYNNKAKVFESKHPILVSWNGETYEKNVSELKQLLGEKRKYETYSIIKRWKDVQKDITSRDWKAILVEKGYNSKRLRQIVDLGKNKGLFNLRPCWLTNPNTTCQIFPLKRDYFDMVIFDEASQCPLEQAMPVIYRAKKVVVAGDEKQLPPTSFFQSGFQVEQDYFENDKSEEELTSDEITQRNIKNAEMEAILNSEDLLSASKSILPDKYLNNHYRSKNEKLINFSNYAFYAARLNVPMTGMFEEYYHEPAIVYKNIKGVYLNRTNRDEADYIVQLVKKIWERKDKPTVGIVTFNTEQRDLIIELVDAFCEKDSKFHAFYEFQSNRKDGNQDVSFFVKNLESVQGDERDVMIFSTTFGRNEKGEFFRSFGPITQEGGDKRLNVAITRAKLRMYIVTSMPISEISDIIKNNIGNPGLRIGGREYLHLFMHYAKAVSESDIENQKKYLDQVKELIKISSPRISKEAVCDSEFEMQVTKVLLEEGFEVDNQVGESGFKIDMAIKHKDKFRGYVLGIECDGAAYHSSFSARMRDLWRQEILKSRGWNIHRIWSSDWWMNPKSEIERIKTRIKSIYESFVESDISPVVVEMDYDDNREVISEKIDKNQCKEEKLIVMDENAKEDILEKKQNKTKPKNEQENNEEVMKLLCPDCNADAVIKMGRFGPFLKCKKCSKTTNVPIDILQKIIDEDVRCPTHKIKLRLNTGRRGHFMGCSLYPKCSYTGNVKIKKEFFE